MNSHQRRRKINRHWKYPVMTEFVSYEEYMNRWQWCYDKIGCRVNSKWREKHRTVGTHWMFVHEKDAILFALRWA